MLIITLIVEAESEQGAICWLSGGISFISLNVYFVWGFLVYSYKIL